MAFERFCSQAPHHRSGKCPFAPNGPPACRRENVKPQLGHQIGADVRGRAIGGHSSARPRRRGIKLMQMFAGEQLAGTQVHDLAAAAWADGSACSCHIRNWTCLHNHLGHELGRQGALLADILHVLRSVLALCPSCPERSQICSPNFLPVVSLFFHQPSKQGASALRPCGRKSGSSRKVRKTLATCPLQVPDTLAHDQSSSMATECSRPFSFHTISRPCPLIAYDYPPHSPIRPPFAHEQFLP